jgi:hypothetical protein
MGREFRQGRFKMGMLALAGTLTALAGTSCADSADDLSFPSKATQGPLIYPLPPAQRAARLDAIRAGLRRGLEDFEARLEKDPTPTTRDLPNAALTRLLLFRDGKGAERLLRMAFAQQDMNPDSPEFGSLPWRIGHPEIVDGNAVMFSMQAMGPILLGHADLLSPAFKAELEPHLRAAIAAMRRRQLKTPSYTNIFLMRTVNLILLGEALGDKDSAEAGYKFLDQWIDYTRANGIHEFDSPTYYFPCLDTLGMGYRYAARPGAREKFRACLDYFWTDIAANYFPARGSLSGPHSRNYDFLRGGGAVSLYTFVEGLRPDQNTTQLDLERVHLLEGESATGEHAGYHPSSEIVNLAGMPNRVVEQRWDTDPNKTRYNYVTPDFAVGSAQESYGNQDKMISIELAAPGILPAISVSADNLDNPYGKIRLKESSGHNKPYHLTSGLTAVQEKGALLALFDLNPRKVTAAATLATEVLLPAGAETISLDGNRFEAGVQGEKAARLNSVIGVREGKTGVAIRVFAADGCAGQEPVLALKADEDGLRNGAVRLAIYHYRGAPARMQEAHIRTGLLILVERCGNETAFNALVKRAGEASLVEHIDGSAWQATAHIGGAVPLTLEAARNLEKGTALFRRVNGHDLRSPALAVNGTDLGARIWASLNRSR